MIAPLLMIASWYDAGAFERADHVGAAVGIAAIGWAIVELARPSSSPLVAMMPAAVAALLWPGAAALMAIAGARVMTAPWRRPGWAAVVPIAGVVVLIGAVVVGSARTGMAGALADRWFGSATGSI